MKHDNLRDVIKEHIELKIPINIFDYYNKNRLKLVAA